MAKRASLTDFTAKKPGADEAPAPAAGAPSQEERRGQTLRLPVSAWRQLKLLGIERGVPVHDLLIEAVNDLFRKHDKPPIA